MIARVWHGWARPSDADAYERYFRDTLAPELQRIPGFCGAHLLRHGDEDEAELVTMTCFESLEAVKRFAGEAHEQAVVSARAQALLTRYDGTCQHFDVAARIPGTQV